MYVKIRDDFTEHRKIIQVGATAAWSYLRGLCYCARNLTDGAIPYTIGHNIATRASIKLLTNILPGEHFPLWHDTGSGYQVHDYLKHNWSKEQYLKYKASKQAAGSIGGRQKAANAKPGRLAPC